jgi:hypothetical protein
VIGGDVRRRKLLVALAGLAVVVAAVSVALRSAPPSRITRENCARIHEGMTQADVEAFLGPPGDYTTGPTTLAFIVHIGQQPPRTLWWRSDSAVVRIDFSAIGTVTSVGDLPVNREPQSALGNLLWRAKRQWHRWFLE